MSAAAAADDDDADDSDDEDTEAAAAPDAENESVNANGPVDNTLHYTQDLSDKELDKRFCGDLPALGSISVGFADSGRLINGVHMPDDPAYQLVVPENAWGTAETVEFLTRVARAVRSQFPNAAPLRINHIGKKDGGWLRPHKSHQSGRDVDIGFYYKDGGGPGGRSRDRTKSIDLALNWAFLKAVVTETDVQLVLTDRKIQKVLHDYAVEKGEDPAWVASIIGGGPGALTQHARRHRDHFHVRFFSARSQELGRRVQPILNKRPEENIIPHRVKTGDTLGAIARKYGTTVAAIEKSNGMKNSFLHLGRVLSVPLRGPCTHCPMPPTVVLPPRRLPPLLLAAVPAPAVLEIPKAGVANAPAPVLAVPIAGDEYGRGAVSTQTVHALLPPVP